MPKPIIAIDCDDVIIPSITSIADFYETAYGVRVPLKDIYSTDPVIWGVDDIQMAIDRVEQYLASEEYRKLPPFQEAIDALRVLNNRYELHMVTGRADTLAQATERMIEAYFPGLFTSIEYTNFFKSTVRSKANVCQALNAALLIDDHLHHALEVAACGTDVLLFGDYPWNQAESLPENVRRVKNWDEVVARLT